MIDKKDLLLLLQKLETAYEPKLTFSQDKVDLWYEMFRECNLTILRKAVDNCICNNEFAPNIAGLMKYYTALANKDSELENLTRRQYHILRVTFEEEVDLKTFEILKKWVFRQPEETRIEKLVEFTQQMVSFYNDCRAHGSINIPTIYKYIEDTLNGC